MPAIGFQDSSVDPLSSTASGKKQPPRLLSIIHPTLAETLLTISQSVMANDSANVELPLMAPLDSNEASNLPNDLALAPTGGLMHNTSLLLPAENSTHQIIESHVAAKHDDSFESLVPPQENDYTLVLEFKSQIGKAFGANPRKWREREFALVKEENHRRFESCAKSPPKFAPAPDVQPNRKRTLPIASSSNPTASRPSKTARTGKNIAPKAIPETGKKATREDKDFGSLLDVCPPLSSLPNKANCLKVDWKGAPIDLMLDPHLNLLHSEEVQLAANLRLDCATYLTSKRRIFLARMAASKKGKEFRKTDAQQACRIDVNKASKLWQAFHKVGWFDSKWIRDST
ncbi:hypothetical protein K3495_g9066 [Podosphaera aphanis]|nr:hypothetical protein K3495_g9066 [Podosphaera aphanis]